MDAWNSWVGQPITRREDDKLLQGKAEFVADLNRHHALHAVFVRSMQAHGQLLGIDVKEACAQPGVVAVLTAADLPGFAPISVNYICEAQPFPNPVLADKTVYYVGQPVALVLAETAQSAVAAAELVSCDVEPMAPVIGLEAAQTMPALFPGWESNRAYRQEWRQGSFSEASLKAKQLIEVTVQTSRLAPSALEPRGFLASWQESGLVCHLPSQAPHRARRTLVQMLGLREEQLHLVCPKVGGAFGGRASLYPEEVAVAWASWHLKRSVFWQSSRSEDLMSASHGRAARLKAQGAFAADGRLLGLKAELAFDLGSWAPFSALVPGWNTGRILPGPYAVPVLEVLSDGFVTNTAAVGIYRGAGRPEAALIMERLMDAGAHELGIDPLAIRQINLPTEPDVPKTSASGLWRAGRHFRALLAQAAEQINYQQTTAELERRRAQGECLGLGINLYAEPCGAGWESARITALPNGRFLLASGSSSQGQGHDTAFAQIAASVLGVSIDEIDVIEADTRATPEGVGALASRSMAIGGSAVALAAERLRTLLKEQQTPALVSENKNASRAIPEEGLSVTEVYTAAAEAWSSGCCIAVVKLDQDTGSVRLDRAVLVDDCGGVINPLLAEGQLVGGFAQGFGETFCESIIYDSSGQIVTGSLMDYALPRADDLVNLQVSHIQPERFLSQPSSKQQETTGANWLGVSGVGESGTIAAPAALLNATVQALPHHHWDRELCLPLKPETIWRMMEKSK